MYKRQAINGAENAALLAAEILAVNDDSLYEKLAKLREDNKNKVLDKNKAIEDKYNK